MPTLNIPTPDIPDINVAAPDAISSLAENGGGDIGELNVSITLPNVQNYEEFKYALQHDPKFEKMVQAMTVGRAAGGSSLRKYRW